MGAGRLAYHRICPMMCMDLGLLSVSQAKMIGQQQSHDCVANEATLTSKTPSKHQHLAGKYAARRLMQSRRALSLKQKQTMRSLQRLIKLFEQLTQPPPLDRVVVPCQALTSGSRLSSTLHLIHGQKRMNPR